MFIIVLFVIYLNNTIKYNGKKSRKGQKIKTPNTEVHAQGLGAEQSVSANQKAR
jgi:hypothetical protein